MSHMSKKDRRTLVKLLNTNRLRDVLEVIIIWTDRKEAVGETVNAIMRQPRETLVSPDAIFSSEWQKYYGSRRREP